MYNREVLIKETIPFPFNHMEYIMNRIKIENIQKSDIVKVNDGQGRQGFSLPVSRVTKTQIIALCEGEEVRFRSVDGKQIQKNGKVVEEGFTMKINSTIRFS